MIALLRPQSAFAPEPLLRLCRDQGLAEPAPGQNHYFADFGRFRLKWERHGEFDDYTVYCAGCSADRPFDNPAITALPNGWTDTLEGELVAAAHVAVLPGDALSTNPLARAAAQRLDASDVLGARIADGDGELYTDLRLDPAGFTRFLLLNHAMSESHAGREVQRALEIETYRMMAMLAFPLAREAARELDEITSRTQTVTGRLEHAPAQEEPALLREITHLAAMTERVGSQTSFRFSAARAYHALVRQRCADLREQRLAGVQTLTGFLERRFAPAMALCESVGQRLERVSARVGRASALLRTRVEIEREGQNQALLEAMNRRARLQLHLQQTVEGLSVAAISYYAVGLVGYLIKAAKAAGAPVNVELATGIAVLAVVASVAWALHRIRRAIHRRVGATDESPGP